VERMRLLYRFETISTSRKKKKTVAKKRLADTVLAPFSPSKDANMCPDVQPERFILASRSPRRRELLARAGYKFEVVPADESVEDSVDQWLPVEQLVAKLAQCKAEAIAAQSDKPGAVVLGCDTLAELDGKILGKPADRREAREMLQSLRGRTHRVLTGICLWESGEMKPTITEIDQTTLRMDSISDAELENYLDSGGWEGKAGAFGYQDRLGWIHILKGSESNVVGLPMELLGRILTSLQQ
jgi:nucleoside triphosphate pyrophosphatase